MFSIYTALKNHQPTFHGGEVGTLCYFCIPYTKGIALYLAQNRGLYRSSLVTANWPLILMELAFTSQQKNSLYQMHLPWKRSMKDQSTGIWHRDLGGPSGMPPGCWWLASWPAPSLIYQELSRVHSLASVSVPFHRPWQWVCDPKGPLLLELLWN